MFNLNYTRCRLNLDNLRLKILRAINCKAMNVDPASLNVGSRRRLNQPNLKSKTKIGQRLLP